MQTVFNVRTSGPGLHEFTAEVARFVRDSGVREGLLTLFVQHTSCSLLVQENADPDVRRDLDEFFRRLVPSSDDPSMQWLTAYDRGARRHAGAHQGGVDCGVAVDTGDGRSAGARDLAGDLSVRAPRPAGRCGGWWGS